MKLPAPAFATAFDAFAATARAYPCHAFLCIPARAERDYAPEGIELDYATALDQVLSERRRYESSGIGHGHRVALLLANRPEHLLHFFALNALGASVVPLNPDGTADEMRYQVEHSQSDLAVAAAHRVADLTAVVQRCGTPIPVYAAEALPEHLQAPSRSLRPDAPGRETEIAVLYTSGTTGRPKGCLISNDYALTSGAWYLERGGVLTLNHGVERLFNPFPLFHLNAAVLSLMAMTLSANCLVLADRFHPKSWWRDLVATRATAMHYMGVIPPVLIKQAPVPEERQHRVKFGLGAGIDPSVHIEFEHRFGIPMVEVWGMTETGRIFSDHLEPRQPQTRAFGRPGEGFDARVVDDRGEPVPNGTPGELWERDAGPNPRQGFFSGYLKDEAATAQAWQGGWFHTGDVVKQSSDGMLYFVDRKKNIIRRSGENISAAEVEAVLITHPKVLRVAVLPIADELRDEEVMACVVLAPDATQDRETAASIFAHCLKELAYYKTPGWIVFRDSLPITSTTKIQKNLIFEAHEESTQVPGAHDFRNKKRRPTCTT